MMRVAPLFSVKSVRAHIVWHSHLVSRREGEEVEGPLVAVDELSGLARSEVDHLGEMQLVGRRVVAEHLIEGGRARWGAPPDRETSASAR